MVVCPNCSSKIQARKVLLLNNWIPITCQVCHSKLQVENKAFFSALGGVGGGVTGGFGFLLLGLFFQTGNLVFLWLFGILFAAVLLVVVLLMFRFVKLKEEMPNYAWENGMS